MKDSHSYGRRHLLLAVASAVLLAGATSCGGKCGGFVPCAPDALLTASTLQLSFADQNVGTASSLQTVTLSATGTSASQIDTITISGDFSQTNTCGKALAPNTSCSVAVDFLPTATGTRTGQLIISQGISFQIVVGLTGAGQ